MSKLISTSKQALGAVSKVQKVFREPNRELRDAYVTACAIVIDDYTGRKLVKAGLASGWRFVAKEDDFVDLWAPAILKPVTFELRNAIFHRAVIARGSGLITGEE